MKQLSNILEVTERLMSCDNADSLVTFADTLQKMIGEKIAEKQREVANRLKLTAVEAQFKLAAFEKEQSKEEVELHNNTHLPYRSWRPHCVGGKAKRRAHRKNNKGAERWYLSYIARLRVAKRQKGRRGRMHEGKPNYCHALP